MSADAQPPPSLRPIGIFVKIANEYASRDVVIYYWCLFRAVQDGMQLDKSSPAALNYLTSMLSVLEQLKKENPNNDALTQDVVAQAHIEDRAQKMFQYARTQEEQGVFNSKVVKAYFTSSFLFDVLTVFGELDENIKSARKFAKWRSTYIHNCLKNGEQPVPAKSGQSADDDPLMNELNDEFNSMMHGLPQTPSSGPNPNVNSFAPPQRPDQPPQPQQPWNSAGGTSGYPSITNQYPGAPTGSTNFPSNSPVPQPRQQINPASFSFVPPQQQKQHLPGDHIANQPAMYSAHITMDEIIEAKKLTKYAMSALDYDDVKTAIDNMHKALAILQK